MLRRRFSPERSTAAVPRSVWWAAAGAILVCFGIVNFRHFFFHSLAWDLGIFDQGIYLISQGEAPISSFLGFHIIGDHAAYILYPISLLYRIYPSVQWLLLIQAVTLGGSGLLVWLLARQAALSERQAWLMMGVYFAYPVVWNNLLQDFHPDVIVVAGLLLAVFAARGNHPVWFGLALALTLGSKEITALAVASVGAWLWLFDQRPRYGIVALLAGLIWFGIAIWVVIPAQTGADASVYAADGRYEYLGSTTAAVIKNLIVKPQLVLGQILTVKIFLYLAAVFLPLIWALALKRSTCLLAAVPLLAINVLAQYDFQHSIDTHYSLPLIPFLMVAVIDSYAYRGGPGWFRSHLRIGIWVIGAWLLLANLGKVPGFLESRAMITPIRTTIQQVPPNANTLAIDYIVPHLSHRTRIDVIRPETTTNDVLAQYEYVVIDLVHPGWNIPAAYTAELADRLTQLPAFELVATNSGVLLYRNTACCDQVKR